MDSLHGEATIDAVIIRPGALGDTLMSLPALVDVKEKMKIAYVGRQPGLRFVEPHVCGTSDLDGAGWHRLFADDLDGRSLPFPRAQCVVAFFGDSEGCIRRNLIAGYPGAAVHVFPFLPPKDQPEHVASYLAVCLNTAGIPVDPKRALDGATSAALIGSGKPKGRPNLLVLHPGSGDRKKNYPLDLWLKFLQRFRREEPFGSLQPVWLLGPAEESLLGEFRDAFSVETQFCPAPNALVRILEESALYLGHDSGITHLAAMMGVPTIALFKGTNPAQWRPLGPCVRIVGPPSLLSALPADVLAAARCLVQSNGGR